MGDMGDDFRAMRAHRQAQHEEAKVRNMATLDAVGVPYRSTNYGETILFREPGKPKADFYPSTGRWRVAGVDRTYRGGALAFLNWYADQGPQDPGSKRAA